LSELESQRLLQAGKCDASAANSRQCASEQQSAEASLAHLVRMLESAKYELEAARAKGLDTAVQELESVVQSLENDRQKAAQDAHSDRDAALAAAAHSIASAGGLAKVVAHFERQSDLYNLVHQASAALVCGREQQSEHWRWQQEAKNAASEIEFLQAEEQSATRTMQVRKSLTDIS
jgi:exonuclease VII small subunit